MASGSVRGRRRLIAAVLASVAALTMITACGQPAFTYIANSDEKTYFKIPSGWHEIDEAPIDEFFSVDDPQSEVAHLRKQLQWSAAYDADATPMPEHMTRQVTTMAPVLYVTIRHLIPAEQSMVSYDYLRDFLIYFPVTAARRQYMEEAGALLPSFELLDDEVLTPDNGLRGVRVIFNYAMPVTGVVHTFDLTAYTNNASSVIYALVIRCAARCYRDRAVEIDDIATSFTVRSQA